MKQRNSCSIDTTIIWFKACLVAKPRVRRARHAMCPRAKAITITIAMMFTIAITCIIVTIIIMIISLRYYYEPGLRCARSY